MKTHADADTPNFTLRVTQGRDRGALHAVAAARQAVLGSAPTCDVRLGDPRVSACHARLEITPLGLRIVDLGGEGGIAVNGLRVTDAHLQGGEAVRIGATTLHVEVGAKTERDHEECFGRVIGASPQMRRLYPLCRQLATSREPIVVSGETGTGKELIAEAIHGAGHPSGGPFVVFDCAAVPSELAGSVLFGTKGAAEGTLGVFEQAQGGTLFFDEIGDLDLSVQPMLLRAIDRSEVQPIGSTEWTRVDVRIIAATQRDLRREVEAGRFREDLFFRLAQRRLRLPPLRDRVGDVPLLARHFWDASGADGAPIPEPIVRRLANRRWPGNVRELQSAVARARATDEPPEDETAFRPFSKMDALIEDSIAKGVPLADARERLVADFERQFVLRLLERHNGNVRRAAAASGLAKRYFQLLKARRLTVKAERLPDHPDLT